MRDNASWRREQARQEAQAQGSTAASRDLAADTAAREIVAALRAEVARLRLASDCGAAPRLRSTPCGSGLPTPCSACQLARAEVIIDDLRRELKNADSRPV